MSFLKYGYPDNFKKQTEKRYNEFLKKTKNPELTKALASLLSYDDEEFDSLIKNNFPNAQLIDTNTQKTDYLNKVIGKIKRKVLGNDSDFIAYMTDNTDVVDFFCGSHTNDFLEALKRLPLFSYQSGYYRRGYKTTDLLYLKDKISELLKLFFIAYHANITLEQWMTQNLSIEEFENTNYSYWLSLKIDQNSAKFINLTEEILCAENNIHAISRPLISAIFQSQNKMLLERLSNLLLAAQRQEGLRQAIVESMDEGRSENFIFMLQTINQNDLIRFSSIKRSVGTWTGLADESNMDRITKKELNLFYDILSNPQKCDQMIESDDNIEHYLALWALAFNNIDNALDATLNNLQSPKTHRRILATYFLTHNIASQITPEIVSNTIKQNKNNKAIITLLINHDLSTYPRDPIGKLFYKKANKKLKSLNNKSWQLQRLLDDDYEKKHTPTLSDYFESETEAIEHFELLKAVLDSTKGKEITIEETPFPWSSFSCSASDFISRMTIIALLLEPKHPELLETITDYFQKLDTYDRALIGTAVLYPPQTPSLRQKLISAITDRSSEFSEIATQLFPTLPEINTDEIKQIAGYYKYKSTTIRTALTDYFTKQPVELLQPVLQDLTASKTETIRLGALDILISLKNSEQTTKTFNTLKEIAQNIQKPTPKEQILIDECLQETTTQSNQQGYGLYNPQAPAPDLKLSDYPVEHIKANEIIALSNDEIIKLFKSLNELITQNADREYKTRWGDTYLLSHTHLYQTIDDDEDDSPIQAYPFPELWINFYEEHIKTPENLFALFVASKLSAKEYDDEIEDELDDSRNYNCNFPVIVDKLLHHDFKGLYKKIEKLPYLRHCTNIINALFESQKDNTFQEKLAYTLFDDLIENYNATDLLFKSKHYWRDTYEMNVIVSTSSTLSRLQTILEDICTNFDSKDSFSKAFTRLYKLNEKFNHGLFPEINPNSREFKFLSIVHFIIAHDLGMISKDEVYREILERNSLKEHYQLMNDLLHNPDTYRTQKFKKFYSQYQKQLKEILDPLTQVILDTELRRSDKETPFSSVISCISKVQGTEIFTRTLTALGSDTLERTSSYYCWGCGTSKKSVLSRLLRVSQPDPDDNCKTLENAMKSANIKLTEKRICELGMYCDKWGSILEELIGWKAFNDACFFFRAHNPEIPEKFEALIARLTPLPLEDLKQGAFDAKWFREIYEKLGDDKLNMLYDAAKYISDGASHSRARKFVDATLNKFAIDETEKLIADKRNKDLVLAYALIPLPSQNDKKYFKDLTRRYQFIQQFLKESKQFGAQRQASEALVVKTALKNLATNAGFDDETRMIWQVETQSFKLIAHLFEPQKIEDYTAHLQIDEQGTCNLYISKDEKALKSVPTKIKKHPQITELTQTKKECTDQWRRARRTLEKAMENEDLFLATELIDISQHPVLAPLIKNIVFIDNNKNIGFFNPEKSFIDETPIKSDAQLRIAHPVDLYHSQKWPQFQKHIFDAQIKQPFKQVFRELYLPLEEEKDAQTSLRYAGHQIQPQKAAATLKSRAWVVDHHEGLQKIDYKHRIIASIYALADWFSPSDIEPPTLEYVCFTDQKSNKQLKISDIPPVLFSETMRDVDLAVSVAHAGAVDPEASHSTIEMRTAIIKHTLPLFKIDNFNLTDKHIIINGKRATYSIHLGSGVVHQMPGPEIATLPVHSQTRGKIFLPFVDDDPKTAEIIAKIILFAQDEKIKDPHILSQIKKS